MSRLIRLGRHHVIALSRHATPVPLPRVVFFTSARTGKDAEGTLERRIFGAFLMALVILLLPDRPIFQMKKINKRVVSARTTSRERERENVAFVRCTHPSSREANKAALITDNGSELNSSRGENLWIWRETLSRKKRAIDVKGKMNHRWPGATIPLRGAQGCSHSR